MRNRHAADRVGYPVSNLCQDQQSVDREDVWKPSSVTEFRG